MWSSLCVFDRLVQILTSEKLQINCQHQLPRQSQQDKSLIKWTISKLFISSMNIENYFKQLFISAEGGDSLELVCGCLPTSSLSLFPGVVVPQGVWLFTVVRRFSCQLCCHKMNGFLFDRSHQRLYIAVLLDSILSWPSFFQLLEEFFKFIKAIIHLR